MAIPALPVDDGMLSMTIPWRSAGGPSMSSVGAPPATGPGEGPGVRACPKAGVGGHAWCPLRRLRQLALPGLPRFPAADGRHARPPLMPLSCTAVGVDLDAVAGLTTVTARLPVSRWRASGTETRPPGSRLGGGHGQLADRAVDAHVSSRHLRMRWTPTSSRRGPMDFGDTFDWSIWRVHKTVVALLVEVLHLPLVVTPLDPPAAGCFDDLTGAALRRVVAQGAAPCRLDVLKSTIEYNPSASGCLPFLRSLVDAMLVS